MLKALSVIGYLTKVGGLLGLLYIGRYARRRRKAKTAASCVT